MKNSIKEIFLKSGIRDIGFCSFEDIKDNLIACRAKGRIPENAKTVILCLFPYKVKDERPDKISRYAAVPDYHEICLEYLNRAVSGLRCRFSENAFEAFIDNSPIPEVKAAALAGLGVIGKNGLLINEIYGSWCFIGEIVCDLELEAKGEIKECPDCGLCSLNCPVRLQKNECLSAVSQKKKELSGTEEGLLAQNGIIWGCDICAEGCPLNKNAKNTYLSEFLFGYRDCYTEGEDTLSRAYTWRGEGVIARNARLNIKK